MVKLKQSSNKIIYKSVSFKHKNLVLPTDTSLGKNYAGFQVMLFCTGPYYTALL